jgi:predicted aspartyl protease
MSRTKSRILRALLATAAITIGRPSLAEQGCSLKQAASLPMHYVNNQILVDFQADDASVSFLVDTGAEYSEIGRALAARLNLPVLAQRGASYGATGATQLYAATVHTLRLGQMVAHNQPFFIDDNFGDGQDRRPAGIFGADFLGMYDFEIDFAAAKFNLYLRDHCPDRVVYWDNEFFKIPFSPGELQTPRINISVSVDGHLLRGILDTGAYNTAMRLATARAKLGYDETTTSDPTVAISGAASTAHVVAHRHRFSSLEFGPITLRNPLIDVVPIDFGKGGAAVTGSHINSMRADQPEIIVGMDVISKLHLYVDYADSALYFTLAQPPHTSN